MTNYFLLVVVPGIRWFLRFMGKLGLAVGLFFLFAYMVADSQDPDFFDFIMETFILSASSLFVTALMPNQKGMMRLIGDEELK
jgi:hypothetical protein